MKAFAAAFLPLLFVAASAGEPGEPTPEEPVEVFTFTDDRIVESSGLVAQDGYFMTINDSGGATRVFTIDPATGDTIGTSRWARAAYDFEALAPAGDGAVWVGDIGDNAHGRETVWLHRVPVGPGQERQVAVTSYEVDYPDGRHDAEALLRHPESGRLYVVSKEVVGRLYELPEQLSEDGVNRMRGIGEVLGVATGGAFFPDGRHLMIRGYGRAAVYTWPDLDLVGEVDLPHQPQGEALAIDAEGRIHLSTEGLHEPVLQIRLPDDIHNPVFGIQPEPEPEPDPIPEPERPLWAYLFLAGMGLIVIYGAVRLAVAFFKED